MPILQCQMCGLSWNSFDSVELEELLCYDCKQEFRELRHDQEDSDFESDDDDDDDDEEPEIIGWY